MAVTGKQFYTFAGGCVGLSDTKNGPIRPMGNAPGAEIEVTIEELDHKSAKTGARLQDDKVVTEKEAKLTVTLDEPMIDNLALFFLSDDARTEQQSVGSALTVNITASELDALYKLGKKNVTVTAVQNTTQVEAVVEGVGYTIDSGGNKNGVIKICSGANVDVDDVLEVTFDCLAMDIDKLSALNSEQQTKYVHFMGNSSKGVDQSFTGKVIITPNGNLSVIQDGEWEQFALDMEFITTPDIANGEGSFEYEGATVTGRK